MLRIAVPCLIAASMLLFACGETGSSAAKPAQPAAWMLDSPPEGAIGVVEAKAMTREGDTVAVRARIGGRKQPVTPGSPAFTVMDLAIPHCGESADDHCATPWDYCCETPEQIRANAATVQLVAADGGPALPDPAAGGLRAMDEVIIVGTVGARPNEDVLTIRATGVYRVPG